MKKLNCKELRKAWIEFFTSKDHLHLPSASLLPTEDPTLLFTSAGMVPFKDYFNGTRKPPYPRIATIQKCLRTTDLESVGKTARHCTFFEMLGNFSFGDYFKKEAIFWAYEFSIKVLELDPERIYITIYKDDDEAHEIWNKHIGIPETRIVRLGREHNWWGPAGDSGPCGPCTELYLDRGEHICFTETGCKNPQTCKPGNDCDRFLEYWNLVFNEFFQDVNGNLHPLPHKGIDTGAGLERIVALLNETDSVYDTDELLEIQKEIQYQIQSKLNKPLTEDFETVSAIRVLTDHIRAITFAISDNIFPDNTGRGYVIRRIIRRALLFAYQLGINEPIMFKIQPKVVEIYKEFYPELETNKAIVQDIILQEEKRFLETLSKGMKKWYEYLEEHKSKSSEYFDGEKAFILYDTYGFPLEITQELAEKENLKVDLETFHKKMEEQKEKSKQSQQWKDFQFPPNFPYLNKKTIFTGYDQYEESSKILSIIYNNEILDKAYAYEHKNEMIIITEKTCFYPEGGGQLGDTGYIIGNHGIFKVIDTNKKGEIILHIGILESGTLTLNEEVQLKIDRDRRKFLTYHHSATHLLNKALREVLGEHIYQTGSLVAPNYLRFDFSHNKKLSEKELEQVEKKVIDAICAGAEVTAKIMPIEEAKKSGAIATFGEKYGDIVRIIEMGENGKYSMEFCGGCHVKNTKEIRFFHIVKESSPGAGNRRIEAVANHKTIEYFVNKILEVQSAIHDLKNKYKTSSIEIRDILEKIELRVPTDENEIKTYFENNPYAAIELDNQLKNIENAIYEAEKQIKKIQKKKGLSKEELHEFIEKLYSEVIELNSIKIFRIYREDLEINDIKMLCDKIKELYTNSMILCAVKNQEKGILYFTCTKKVNEKGLDCSELLKYALTIIDGKGGGRSDLAQGGGNPKHLKEALKKTVEIIESKLSIIK